MPNLFIDPYLFALPLPSQRKELFEDYISNILQWKTLKDGGWGNLFTLRQTHEILLQSGRYPFWDELKQLLVTFSIDYIQPRDIVNLVDALIFKLTKIEDYLSISDYLVDFYNIIPEIVNRESNFLEKLSDLMNFASLKSIFENEPGYLQIILTTGVQHQEIQIISRIALIEFYAPRDVSLPLEINSIMKVCINFDDLCKKVDPSMLFKNANNVDLLRVVLSIGAYQYAKTSGLKTTFEDINNFTIDKAFVKNIKDFKIYNHTDLTGSLLRSISETLLNQNLGSTHALRTGSAGNNPQLQVGGFSAWRRDVDYDFHIHYWKRGNRIVLANIALHNDFSISDPSE